MAESERIVVLIDMDCFYVQVEQRRQPDIRNKPCAVVQYNKWKGGGIIAVSYEARAEGVSRNMRGDDAKEKCPDIVLCMVPTAHGKADLTRYRDAGAEVIQVLLQFSGIVERASIDEAYIDLTKVVEEKINAIKRNENSHPTISDLQHTYVVGYPSTLLEANKQDERLLGLEEYMSNSITEDNVLRLLIAAALVEEIRFAIYEQTSFRCSAGISHNKVLSKLACGINKPNKQTILPMNNVSQLFNRIKIGKIRNLGGKLGHQLSEKYQLECIGQLTNIPKTSLIKDFGTKTGDWLYEICRGVDREPVKERHVAQSVGCSKNFTGGDALKTRSKVQHWIGCLVTELVERLVKDQYVNNRVSKGLTIHVGLPQQKPISRSCPINKYDVVDITKTILSTLELLNKSMDKQADVWNPPITMIGISAGKFKDHDGGEKHPKLNLASKTITSLNHEMKSKPNEINDLKPITSHFFSKPACSSPLKEPTITSSPQKPTNSSYLSPLKPTRSSTRPIETTMDKKRSFFVKNFGDVNTSSAEEEKSSSVKKSLNNCVEEVNINSIGNKTKPALNKKSFFACMREKNSPKCIIESAFDEVTYKEESQQDENKSPRSTSASEKQGLHRPTNCETPVNPLYSMDEVDMDVFNSLPLFLQQEIKFSSRKKDASPTQSLGNDVKRRKLAPPSGQISISGFLSSQSGNTPQTQSPRKKTAAKKGKTRKGTTVQYGCLEENSVPFGFFRARTHASAAIRSAVEQQLHQSQKKKSVRDENKNQIVQ